MYVVVNPNANPASGRSGGWIIDDDGRLLIVVSVFMFVSFMTRS
jgi:hypothetical protein